MQCPIPIEDTVDEFHRDEMTSDVDGESFVLLATRKITSMSRIRMAIFEFVFAGILCSLSGCGSDIVQPSDDKPKMDRKQLNGSWKVVEYHQNGKRIPPTKEQVWIIDGDKLYVNIGGYKIAKSLEIRDDVEPKQFNTETRFAGVAPAHTPDERNCYQFLEDKLLITRQQSENSDQKLLNLGPAASVEFGLTLIRIGDEATIPDDVLKQYAYSTVRRTSNRDAEEAVLKLLTAAAIGRPVSELESLVIDANIPQLPHLVNHAGTDPQAIADELKEGVFRDILVGETIHCADGSEVIVGANDLGPDNTLLMLTRRAADQMHFGVHRIEGEWKVDASNLIELKRMGPGSFLVFEGVRTGMQEKRVRELLADYSKSRNFKIYRLNPVSETELALDVGNGQNLVRHTFRFANGRLASAMIESVPSEK